MNQCDGCVAGYPIPLKDGIHRYPDGSPFMCCERRKYIAPEEYPEPPTDDELLNAFVNRNLAMTAADYARRLGLDTTTDPNFWPDLYAYLEEQWYERMYAPTRKP